MGMVQSVFINLIVSRYVLLRTHVVFLLICKLRHHQSRFPLFLML